jgi:hypothetical protein
MPSRLTKITPSQKSSQVGPRRRRRRARRWRCGARGGKQGTRMQFASPRSDWWRWIAPGGGRRRCAVALGGSDHCGSFYGETTAKADQHAADRALGGHRVEYRVVGRPWA